MGGLGSKEASVDLHLAAESTVLERGLSWWRGVQRSVLPPTQTPAPVSYKLFDVPIAPHQNNNPIVHAEQEKFGKSLHIHTALFAGTENELEESAAEGETPIVMLHGYGSGIGVYSACLGPLASSMGRKVYAVDGLGCGFSARPAWTLGHGTASDLNSVEEYSADALELWRQEIGAEKIILCGHSIGGYLSVAYAERYPERVEKLILLSPAGVAGPPPADQTRKPSALFRFARFLWSQGISPLSASKYVFGRYFIDKYVNGRFRDSEWLDKPAIADYLHGVWTHGEPSAGAYHHNTILLPGAYARRPLQERILQLKVPAVAAIYGTSDWMNPNHFARIMQRYQEELVAREQIEECEEDEDEQLLADLQLMLVDSAGHNLQIDNPLGFTAAMQAYLVREENCSGRTFEARHVEVV